MDFSALRAEQIELAARAVNMGSLEQVQRFVALDMSSQVFIRPGQKLELEAPLFAAAVVFERGNPKPLEVATAVLEPSVPYKTGFLAFREAPVLLKALEGLQSDFDMLWLDGHGILHPRRCGIATHLGVLLNKPALGVAKTPLIGTHDELGMDANSSEPIRVAGETLGYALRLRAKTKPIYVSSGHLCSGEAALAFVRECNEGYRLPWPTRGAHQAANTARLARET
jgi:deoxyribonuclease V